MQLPVFFLCDTTERNVMTILKIAFGMERQVKQGEVSNEPIVANNKIIMRYAH